jgi:carboxymethylenebutenolidase
MVRSLLVVLALSTVACRTAAPAVAADAASPTAAAAAASTPPATATAARGGQAVSFTNGGSGYLATPAGAGKHPAILVIQEWWGMNDWVKGNADRFAGQGYVALAVDLYRGRVASSPDEAHELMRGLPEDRGIADMKAAFMLLAARPDVDASRIGVIGWCMGGGYALDFATAEPQLRAAVVNYGHLVTDAAKIDAIHAALLGNFGVKDRGIPAEDVTKFAADLKAKGKTIDFKEFDSVGHAFMNPGSKQGYDEGAAKEAWSRIDSFFEKTLKGG